MVGAYFNGFLWAPAEKYWNNIIRYISSKYQITLVRKYKFKTFHDLENMIMKLYRHDPVSITSIKNVKLKLLSKYSPICLQFQIYVNEIEMIPRGRHNIADKGVLKMKKEIRKRYRSKIVGYQTDIIIHISDNDEQTECINKLIQKDIVTL